MRRRTVRQLQVAQYRREHELTDSQPHMTLTPAKAGQLWLGGKHGGHPDQRPSLLSPAQAFAQGFHAGARWGYRVGRTRRQK